jgi:hypothetical protein
MHAYDMHYTLRRVHVEFADTDAGREVVGVLRELGGGVEEAPAPARGVAVSRLRAVVWPARLA